MMSLSMFSSRFKMNEKFALFFVGLAWLSSLAYGFWHSGDQMLIPVILTVISIISVWTWHQSIQSNKALLKKLNVAANEWRQGNVHVRITKIGGKQTLLQQITWKLNDLMDQVETAQVDMYYSMAYVTYGDFSRKSYPAGLHGGFSHALKRLNALTKILSSTTSGVNELMSALSTGDFNKKIDLKVEGEYAKAINNATDAMETMRMMIDNIGEVMGRVAQGDISQRIQAQGQGDFAVLKNNVNLSLDALEGSFHDISRITNALAKGDLTQSSEQFYPGTFGSVISGMNHTVENLKVMVGDIKDSGEVIGAAAKEITAGNYDLSHRTIDQATSLANITASMNQFTETIKQNSENTRQANALAQVSSDFARNGVVAVGQVVKTMDGINESSRKIVDIISVIDSIAFQTNILALNAAVEAARAGEQGRGFAVVATEVRSLAQRAAAAAGEIKNLINDSVEKVEDGSHLVIKAGKTMEDILNSIDGVTNTIKSITKSSDEQIVSIGYMNESLTQIDDTTQQNSALVEESAASAKMLEDQTVVLSSTISNFKLNA
jgi:methyl-accepting chemotaxis protein